MLILNIHAKNFISMSDSKPLSGIKAPDNRQRYHGSPSSPNREENGEHHDDGGCTFVGFL
jgi:hypothetical protein